MNTKFKEILGKTDDVIFRYPMVLAMALIAAVSAVVGITLDNEPNQFLVTKLAFTACLGISLMFGIKMLSQRIGKEIIFQILGTIFLFWFFWYLPSTEKDFKQTHAFVIFPVFILSHLFVSFSAFLNKKSELNFWQFNKNLFINIFLTAVFTGVLVGGVMLAVLAVDKLFDLNFDGRIYPKTILFLAILGSCFIFLLFNDKGLEQLEKDGDYPQILKFFTQFILIPLLLIYVVILYLYSAKILINWELPKGWVSYLILIYSILGILPLLLVHPLKEDSTKSWVKIFSKIFYYTLIPLLVLLFVAIYTRILEYGYTEPRYYVLLLAIWLTTVVLYFVFFKNPNIKFIPISLFVFGVFALIFPYFNAFSVSKRSQKNELVKILDENKLLANGKIDFSKNVSSEVADEVANKIGFLSLRNEGDFYNQFLDEKTIEKIKKSNSNHIYGISSIISSQFSNVNKTKKDENYRLELISDNNFKNISNYQYVAKIRDFYENGLKINQDNILIVNKLNPKEKVFKIYLNNSENVDLMPILKGILNKNKTGQVEVPEISAETDLGKYHIKILFDNLVLEKTADNQENIYFENALVFVKEK